MINVTAKPFRMIASGNCEKLNQELNACFVGPWKWGSLAVETRMPYILV